MKSIRLSFKRLLLGQEGKKVNKSKIMQPLNYIKLAFNGL